MQELVFYGALFTAVVVGALFARFFPRLGLVLGWTLLAGTAIGLIGIIHELVKMAGAFYGLVIGAVVALLALVPVGAAVGMLGMGKRVLEEEEARGLEPEPVPAGIGAGSNLTPDIETYVERVFGATHAQAVRRLLEDARLQDGAIAGSRLVRCALVESRGSIEGLREQVRRMRSSHNDLIQAAECEVDAAGQLVRVRDLAQPFEVREPAA